MVQIILTLLKRYDREIAVKMSSFEQRYVNRIKSIPGRKWLSDQLLWTFPYSVSTIERFIELFANEEVYVEALLFEECSLSVDEIVKKYAMKLRRSEIKHNRGCQELRLTPHSRSGSAGANPWSARGIFEEVFSG